MPPMTNEEKSKQMLEFQLFYIKDVKQLIDNIRVNTALEKLDTGKPIIQNQLKKVTKNFELSKALSFHGSDYCYYYYYNYCYYYNTYFYNN